MTRGVEHIDPTPEVIPARVNIHHLQLRDLLQPTGIKDKVLFVSRLQIEQADFATLKAPTTYCTLDFQPNCLTTGCGLLAAGGQHGGSINNAITIQPDLNHPSSSSSSYSSRSTASLSSSPAKPDLVDSSPAHSYSPWARDEPSSSSTRPGVIFSDEEMESELSESVFEELAAAYGFDPASVNHRSRYRRSPLPSLTSPSLPTADAAPIKVMVSNNDQSIKLYKLRPPKSSPGALGRIESGLPGLSRNTTLQFPTAINHSSLSPDQRTLIAVGDTPEVFIHSVSRTGEHSKLATYSASSDACFSTTWSSDGTKFAVASQDGVVSVWDVRSSRRLASVSASQGGAGSGAVRVAKFSPCGRFLAFTEHRNYWNVTDTVTFTETQRIAAPTTTSDAAGEAWVERRLAADERFRLVTGGDEAIARDRERRSIIHANFMREWNRAVNLVDSTSRASHFPDWLANPTSTTGSARREDLLSAALNQPPVHRGESHSINISGLCWDPDGEHVYVSTERCIAKYNVCDPRVAVTNAGML
uniref:Uncharacterized protein n=1 Tax=Kalmanozyma brasiliensis (strain GHG001) TaxID=1365824 RepID=V5EXS8_KALBG